MKLPNDLQQYLRLHNDTNKLHEDFGIRVYEHPQLPLIGLKYNQIDSPKYENIVRQCRGTVLEKGTWNIVAQPFLRFFNLGEKETDFFDWSNFSCVEKLDGSLAIYYNYNSQWHMNTSGSFGFQSISDIYPQSWRELFWATMTSDVSKFNQKYTYIFELTSPYNKIVRKYPKPEVRLIGAFDLTSPDLAVDLSECDLDKIATELNLNRPEIYYFKSIKEISNFLLEKENSDPTFEGLVIRDSNNLRLKIKNKTYLALHRMAGGDCTYANMIDFVLAGEEAELLTYFPEFTEKVMNLKTKIEEEYNNLERIWNQTKNIENQKEFAQTILGKTKFTSILFTIRKDKSDLKEKWLNSRDIIIKMLNL